MKQIEFNTTTHNGIIEIPQNNAEIKNKEVKVIVMWDEKTSDEKQKNKSLTFSWEGGLKELKGDFNGVSLQHHISKTRE